MTDPKQLMEVWLRFIRHRPADGVAPLWVIFADHLTPAQVTRVNDAFLAVLRDLPNEQPSSPDTCTNMNVFDTAAPPAQKENAGQ